MTLTERTRQAELEALRWENVRLRASRDSLQVALDDMRRQVRALQAVDVLDLREPVRDKEPSR